MKIILKHFGLIILSIALFTSCSVTKRKHRKGYHVEVLSKDSKKATNDSTLADTTRLTKKEKFELQNHAGKKIGRVSFIMK